LLAGLRGALGRPAEHELTARITSHFSASHVALTNSGTAALTLAVKAAAGERNALIALPGYSCYDVATAADGVQARVVLYDIDPTTLAPDEKSFKRALAQGPRAVIAAHLYGVPVDIALLRAEADRTGAVVIEDAAQGIGASLRGTPLGALGSLAVLSFGRGKGLSGGGGGALLANDADGVRRLQSVLPGVQRVRAGWKELLRSSVQWLGGRPQVYGLLAAIPFLKLGETIYHPPAEPDSISRAAARIIDNLWLSAHHDSLIRRVHATALLKRARASQQWRSIDVLPDANPGWLRLPLWPIGRQREVVLSWKAKRLGVMAGYPLPLSQLPGFRDRCTNASDRFPGAEFLASQLITLPTHRLLSRRDLNALEEWLER
jgi:dTDP-4-amino-4,6-dideoxygalactose transaminase